MDFRESQYLRLGNYRLVVKIKYEKPIDLLNVVGGLKALGEMYVDSSGDKRARFLIEEVRQSSIEMYLAESLSLIKSAIEYSEFTLEFWVHIISVINIFKERKEQGGREEQRKDIKAIKEKLNELTRKKPVGSATTNKELEQIDKIVGMVDNPGESAELALVDGSSRETYINCTFNINDASTIRDSIKELRKYVESPEECKKRLFRWEQPNIGRTKRGVIESIYSEPCRVVFIDDSTEARMITGPGWSKRLYMVNVGVERVRGVPKVYRITQEFPEESFMDDTDEDSDVSDISINIEEPAIAYSYKHQQPKKRKKIRGYTLYGELYGVRNWKEAMIGIFNKFIEKDREFVNRFRRMHPQYWNDTRQLIVDRQDEVYLKSPHLIKHARQLDNGQYIDTNLSQDYIETRIKDACEVMGLRYGVDLILHEM